MAATMENPFWVYLIGSSVISAFIAGAFALWAARTNSEPNKQKVVSDTQGSIIGDLQEERSALKVEAKEAEKLIESQKVYIEQLKNHIGVLELRLLVNNLDVPPRPKRE